MVFYVVIVILWLTNSVSIYIHVLAWVFVASRMIHATIHVGSNYVPLRRKVFMAGFLLLMAMTSFLVYSLLIMPVVSL